MMPGYASPASPNRTRTPNGPVDVDGRLTRYLQSWLGAWPPWDGVQIVIWPGRDAPGWDGGGLPGLGVQGPLGTVLSLSPRLVSDPADLDRDLVERALRAPDPMPMMGTALGQPDLGCSRALFRWSDRPAALPEIGDWVIHDDPRVPPWLQAFPGDVLVAWDEAGRVAAGVGLKRHNRYGHELAVVTEAAHQGQGLARMLVAQAARRVLAAGAVPLYFHLPDNSASGRVADAAGFPDRGWYVVALYGNGEPDGAASGRHRRS